MFYIKCTINPFKDLSMQSTTTAAINTPARLDDAMGRYGDTYDEAVRNLAELIHAMPASAAPWVKDTLHECAKLYARKHGVKMSQVRAATADYAAWELAFEAFEAINPEGSLQ